jgi:hypothetical protein
MLGLRRRPASLLSPGREKTAAASFAPPPPLPTRGRGTRLSSSVHAVAPAAKFSRGLFQQGSGAPCGTSCRPRFRGLRIEKQAHQDAPRGGYEAQFVHSSFPLPHGAQGADGEETCSEATSRKGLAPLDGPLRTPPSFGSPGPFARRRPLLPKSSGALSGPSRAAVR